MKRKIKKKKQERVRVRCSDCIYSLGIVHSFNIEEINFLIDCDNIEANPNGDKMGTYERECKYYKAKEDV